MRETSTLELIMSNRIWVDVEDLFIWKIFAKRPSGIQRLQFELCRALVALPQIKDRVAFVRHDARRKRLVAVPWKAVELLYDSVTLAPTPPPSVLTLVLRKVFYALPQSLRRVASLQGNVFTAVAELARVATARSVKRLISPKTDIKPDEFSTTARSGDILAILGGAWVVRDRYVERAVRQNALRCVLLIYDIIPLRRPEWFDPRITEYFRNWFDRTLPLADMIFTISASTARDVAAYARENSLALRNAPIPIPIGTAFQASRAVGGVSSRLPAPGNYVLFVSTIEPRKNHALLFRIWRRLATDMPAASVPTLVFAGGVGWLASDFLSQLRNSRFLDGKIVHIDSPTDDELAALYDGCLFTLFPSYYEGWGLPITESHAFGRPCIISDTSSLPEAGGTLARYIDPDNATEAYKLVRTTIEDRAGLAEWRDRVKQEFKPVEWSASARAVLTALGFDGSLGKQTETERSEGN
jgi:glycosyltransferase involved in cell wall biosynthesis